MTKPYDLLERLRNRTRNESHETFDKHLIEEAADEIERLRKRYSEITPAMIEAGVSVLCAFDTFFEGEEVWAERIYLAMQAANPKDSKDD